MARLSLHAVVIKYECFDPQGGFTMARSKKISVDRRGFLKGAAAGAAGAAAALVAKPEAAKAQEAAEVRRPATPNPLPGAKQTAAETTPPPRVDVWTTDRPGSDFMVDVIKTLGFEYVAANPGSSFRGIHESLINYGGNKAPELLTCCHEESSVGMAHGYAKIEGKPMMIMAHGTVGLQHASMAIYNAYADRVPVYILLGNIPDGAWRRSDVEWTHSVQDAAAMVRDYTKWDDAPVSLGGFAESAVRAYKIAMTPPMEPVVIVADAVMQEEPIPEADRGRLQIPKLTLASPPAGDYGAVKEAAKMLVNAESPTIIAGRVARTPEGIKLLVELAETLQAPIIDKHFRMNFPTAHPLYGAGTIGSRRRAAGPRSARHVAEHPHPDAGEQDGHGVQAHHQAGRQGHHDLRRRSVRQEQLSGFRPLRRSGSGHRGRCASDACRLLIDECRKLITPERKAVIQARAAKLAEVSRRNRERDIEQAAWAWDASPVSTARMAAELWNQIKTEDWSLVSDLTFVSNWPGRLWDFDKPYHFIGGHGAYGVGYGAPAAVGAALANKKHGRISVNIQCDGDLNYAPGVLWTAAHHRIPMLNIMHNNRAYHQELMYVEDMAARARRGVERAKIGTAIRIRISTTR